MFNVVAVLMTPHIVLLLAEPTKSDTWNWAVPNPSAANLIARVCHLLRRCLV